MQGRPLPLFLVSLLFHLLILYSVSLVNSKKYYASPYRKVKIVSNKLRKNTEKQSQTIPTPVEEENKLPIEPQKIGEKVESKIEEKIEEKKSVPEKKDIKKPVEPKIEPKKPKPKKPKTEKPKKKEDTPPKTEEKKPKTKQEQVIEQKSIFDNVSSNNSQDDDDDFLFGLEKDIISSLYILTQEERMMIKNSLAPHMVSLHNIIGSKNINNLELIFRIDLDENAAVNKITVIKNNCEQILTSYQCERLLHDSEQAIMDASPFPTELGDKIFDINREYLVNED